MFILRRGLLNQSIRTRSACFNSLILRSYRTTSRSFLNEKDLIRINSNIQNLTFDQIITETHELLNDDEIPEALKYVEYLENNNDGKLDDILYARTIQSLSNTEGYHNEALKFYQKNETKWI